jgi:hypothetical protein
VSRAPDIAAERTRIEREYARRSEEIDADRYAPWQPAAILERAGRLRTAARLLREANCFPRRDAECLEIGYGSGGWLPDVIGWGVEEPRLHGIELGAERARRAQALLPAADLRIGDATRLPWPDRSFALVILSTVFSSILDTDVRRMVAAEAARVTAPGGAVLWYDLKMNNPSNPHVRGIGRQELAGLFPDGRPLVRSATLAPPLARLVAPRSMFAAQALECVPFLRTHLVATIVRS